MEALVIVFCISVFAFILSFILKPKKGKSVSQVVAEVKQPKGGYLPLKLFKKEMLGDITLYENENISPTRVGMTVDYLTRIKTGANKNEVFKIAIRHAEKCGQGVTAKRLLQNIRGIDNTSIRCAVKLCGYEAKHYANKNVATEQTEASYETICNIREMVKRSINALAHYGGCVWSGFTFEGGYTKKIVFGEGDFLTPDTLWDFKTYKSHLTTKNTLQILIYWRLGLRSKYQIYKNIKYLGLYNPRTNTAYRIPIQDIPKDVIKEIDAKIIGGR